MMAPDDMQQDRQRGSDQGSTPTPDPTILTTEALHREVSVLKELIEQRIKAECDLRQSKIDALSNHVTEIEKRRRESKEDAEKSLDAAFDAQQAAISKSETATTKTIDSLSDKLATEVTSLRRDIDDLKGNLTAVQARKSGGDEVTQQRQAAAQPWQLWVAGAVLTLIVVLANVLTTPS